MKKPALLPASIEDYITNFPPTVREYLEQLYSTIREAAPGAEESISYQMPAFKLHGPLIYFAGYDKHIGFYPTPSGIEKFKKELSVYKSSKGAVQFPLDKPLPLKLVSKIVEFRVRENQEKASIKGSKRAKSFKVITH